jgi:DSF synthase
MNGSIWLIDRVQEGKSAATEARHPAAPVVPPALARHRFSEFELDFDVAERILFCYFNFTARPCFTAEVLREAHEVQRLVRSQFGDPNEREPAVRFLVQASRSSGVWNLGADHTQIVTLLRNRDRVGLRRYAHACCELGFANATGLGFDLPVISVALVQGDAFGSGFEMVLSNNLIVAERSAKFALPETGLNLFPGLGGLSFLARRLPPALAERLVMSGEIFTAEQLHALGAVDVLAPDGQGMAALHNFIGPQGCRHVALRALYRARRMVNPLTLEELFRVADLWVEAAFKLDEAALTKMSRLAARAGGR